MFSISLQTDYWHRAETDETHNRTLGALPAPHRNSQTQYRPIKWYSLDNRWWCYYLHEPPAPNLSSPSLSPCICGGSRGVNLILPLTTGGISLGKVQAMSQIQIVCTLRCCWQSRAMDKSRDKAEQLLWEKTWAGHLNPEDTSTSSLHLPSYWPLGLYLEEKYIRFRFVHGQIHFLDSFQSGEACSSGKIPPNRH